MSKQRSTLSKQHSTLLPKRQLKMSNEFIGKFRPFHKVECCFDIVAGFGNSVERKNRNKRPYLANGLTDRQEICTATHIDRLNRAYQQKILTFKKPRWRTVVILITDKLLYLRNGLTDRYDSTSVNKLRTHRHWRQKFSL